MPTYVPATPQVPNEIRRHANADIEGSMRAVLANLKPGRRGAVVAYWDQAAKEVHGAIYSRKPGRFFFLPPGEWSFVATAAVPLKGQLVPRFGAAVAYEW